MAKSARLHFPNSVADEAEKRHAAAVIRESMSTKNWIRTVVLAGILAWPGVETYRYFVAVGQRDAALLQHERVAARVAQAQSAHASREQKNAPVVPVAHPASGQPQTPSNL